MKFASVRDLRSRPSEVWESLAEDEVVVTSNGKPIALMTRIEEHDDIEALLREIRLGRTRNVWKRLQDQAAATAGEVADEEIGALVDEVRSAPRQR